MRINQITSNWTGILLKNPDLLLLAILSPSPSSARCCCIPFFLSPLTSSLPRQRLSFSYSFLISRTPFWTAALSTLTLSFRFVCLLSLRVCVLFSCHLTFSFSCSDFIFFIFCSYIFFHLIHCIFHFSSPFLFILSFFSLFFLYFFSFFVSSSFFSVLLNQSLLCNCFSYSFLSVVSRDWSKRDAPTEKLTLGRHGRQTRGSKSPTSSDKSSTTKYKENRENLFSISYQIAFTRVSKFLLSVFFFWDPAKGETKVDCNLLCQLNWLS